jgi:glucose/arabinose dehydrogenase
MPNIGKKRMMIPKILTLILFFLLSACSANPPQAVSTQPPINEQATQPIETLEATEALSTPTITTAPTQPDNQTPSPPPESDVVASETPMTVSFPDPALYSWNAIIEDLIKPIGLTNAGDGSGRLFILEQEGAIIMLDNGVRLEKPFLDIRDRVGADASERGLLGIAFHPRYTENGYFFVNYTDKQGNTVIARFQVSSQDPGFADPGSEQKLLQVAQPYANHNGGGVEFGADGYLYIGLGDGGAGGDPLQNAQSTETLLGKLLRIDVDGAGAEGLPYAIPADNPFFSSGGLPEIWAYGLRNPWRFSFDRLNGDLYIGDVGQNRWEEINYLPAGSPGGVNFGWDYLEGTHPFEGTAPGGLMDPIFEYDHSLGCSVTGGVVYRGQEMPEWNGIYLFGDYCSGNIWGLFRNPLGAWESQKLFNNVGNIASFGSDDTGNVYVVIHSGSLLKLTRNAP